MSTSSPLIPNDVNDLSLSQHSLSSSSSQEDWDRSSFEINSNVCTTTPRNSVLFPADGGHDQTPGRSISPKPDNTEKRSISELLRLHAEKGTNVKFSAEEASRGFGSMGESQPPTRVVLNLFTHDLARSTPNHHPMKSKMTFLPAQKTISRHLSHSMWQENGLLRGRVHVHVLGARRG
jgi:hypothetical protein